MQNLPLSAQFGIPLLDCFTLGSGCSLQPFLNNLFQIMLCTACTSSAPDSCALTFRSYSKDHARSALSFVFCWMVTARPVCNHAKPLYLPFHLFSFALFSSTAHIHTLLLHPSSLPRASILPLCLIWKLFFLLSLFKLSHGTELTSTFHEHGLHAQCSDLPFFAPILNLSGQPSHLVLSMSAPILPNTSVVCRCLLR